MATKDYSATAALATRLLTKFGAPAKLVYTVTTGGNGTPTNPGTQTEVAVDCVAAIVDYSERDRAGTAIQEGDRKALVSVPASLKLGAATSADGSVQAFTSVKLRFPATGGRDYQIMAGKAESPAGVDVLYELRART